MLSEHLEKRVRLGTELENLATLAGRVGAKGLATRIQRDLVNKLREDRFHLVCVGEFNHGKTALVNALLGQDLLRVGVTPTTSVIHHLVWSETPRLKRVDVDGTSKEIPIEELSEFADSGKCDETTIQYLEVGCSAEILKDQTVLVDTPGVNDLSLSRAEITYDYIPRADAVLFVLDAGQPLKESERDFLEKQLLGKNRDKVVFVVAKADIWSEAEREEGLEYLRGKLGKLVTKPRIFLLSAHQKRGVGELRSYLSQFLAAERGSILVHNVLGEAQGAVDVLRRGIEALRRSADLSLEQLERRIDLLEKDLAGHSEALEERRLLIREQTGAIKGWVRRDLDRFCEDVCGRLPKMLEGSSSGDIRSHLGPFLEDTFRRWAEAETEEIATSLEQLAERVLAMTEQDAQDLNRRLSEALGQGVLAPAIEVDRFAYDVGIFAMFSMGLGVVFANTLLGGVLLAAAPALALWNRDRTEAEIRKRACELVPQALQQASARAYPKLEGMIDQVAERLDQWVVEAARELHEEVIAMLQHAKTTRVDESEEHRIEEDRCAAARQELEKIVEVLAGFKPGLRAPLEVSSSSEVPA